MAITENPTLPQEWDPSQSYQYKDKVLYCNVIYLCIKNPDNNLPPFNNPNWAALDIYKKVETVMPHGPYAGDDEFWERDELVVTPTGDVLINNENTGINVRGPRGGGEIEFDDLTAVQREMIRGPRGFKGEQGEKGETGERGPTGYVDLSPEQVEALKGDTGKSNYDLWLEAGHIGSVNDYLAWLVHSAVTVDKQLSNFSSNPVENRVITGSFEIYQSKINELLHQYEVRLTALEDRLKAIYNDETYYFRFGITTEGKYGYYYGNGSNIIPFDNTNNESLSTMMTEELQGVVAQAYGLNNSAAAYSTIADHNPYSPTSLEGDVSSSGGEDNMPLYGDNVESITLTDYIDGNIEYTEIFRDGLGFLEREPIYTYGYDSMLFRNTHLITDGSQENVKGIYFNTELGKAYSRIYFKVEPLTAGETVECQIGVINQNYVSLQPIRDYIADPTTKEQSGIVFSKNGSFNERQLFFMNMSGGEGVYFCSTNGKGFKIQQMYCF